MPAVDLSDQELRAACEGAVLEIMETMFFELPLEAPRVSPHLDAAGAGAAAGFEGSAAGSLSVYLSGDCPSRLAAAFLGLEPEEVGEAEEQNLLMELANVLCGATMSRFRPGGRLWIAPPALVPCGPDSGRPWLSFPLENGDFCVSLHCRVQP